MTSLTDLRKKMERLDISIDYAKRMKNYYRSEKNDPSHQAFGTWMEIHKNLIKDKEKLMKKVPGDKRWF